MGTLKSPKRKYLESFIKKKKFRAPFWRSYPHKKLEEFFYFSKKFFQRLKSFFCDYYFEELWKTADFTLLNKPVEPYKLPKKEMKHLKWSVANKIIEIVNAKMLILWNILIGLLLWHLLYCSKAEHFFKHFSLHLWITHLYVSCWFSWHTFSDTKSIPENYLI